MRRLLVCVVAVAALAGNSQAATFTVVEGTALLPSAEVPNGGQLVMPTEISTPPLELQVLSYGELLALWQEAGEVYGIPWEVLASINQIESDFGRNMGPSSAGAVGWMQFLPSTWDRWGVDGNGDGIADPWNATDAVYAAARYLAAAGAHEDLRRSVFAYNHSEEYVDAVLAGASRFATDPLAAGLELLVPTGGPSIEELEARLDEARGRVAELEGQAATLAVQVEQAGWNLEAEKVSSGDPTLSDDEFARALADTGTAELDLIAAESAVAGAQSELQLAVGEVVTLEQDIALAQADSASIRLDGLLPEPPTEAARAVIDYALGKLGVPYRWGGNHGYSLEQMASAEPDLARGFDCSSLVAWSFAHGAGLYVGDWTGTQWEYGATAPGATRGAGPAQFGAPPLGGFLPGDLIFFNDTDHVALYLGNDLFVHAPHTGDVVRIAQLSTYRPVWGWVRYRQISGIETPLAPAEAPLPAEAPAPEERVFTIVAEPGDDPVTFNR
jgi:cell wall-associated NlpC family hydrolase